MQPLFFRLEFFGGMTRFYVLIFKASKEPQLVEGRIASLKSYMFERKYPGSKGYDGINFHSMNFWEKHRYKFTSGDI